MSNVVWWNAFHHTTRDLLRCAVAERDRGMADGDATHDGRQLLPTLPSGHQCVLTA
jgi:hypothetical protein